MAQDNVLHERLAFIGLDADSQSDLVKAKPVIEAALSDSLDRFYQQVARNPETARFFDGPQKIAGAKSAQAQHWSRIAAAQFDATYVENVRRIGATHARIGLEPRWYIGGYGMVLQGLIEAVVSAHTRQRRVWRRGGDERLTRTLSAVVKAALLDMDLSISVYLDELGAARAEAERKRMEGEAQQRAVVEATAGALSKLAAGDLTGRIDADFVGDYRKLKDDFNQAMQSLEAAMAEIADGSATMQSGASEISQASDDLSMRTERQAATLEQTAAALDQVTSTVRNTADSSGRAQSVVVAAQADAHHSAEVVSQAITAMSAIEQSAARIGQITSVIDEIAFQTNLLALNAGVEAARAGDAGKGFAVVASEVRALAQRSADAAKEIKSLISASSDEVKAGVGLVRQTGAALSAINDRVGEINGLMTQISASAQEQSAALAQVNSAINLMDQTTQQNAAMVEEATAASHGLTQEAHQLDALVSRFKVQRAIARKGETTPRRPSGQAASGARSAPRLRAVGNAALAAADDWSEF
jgi:methyl-accepting chemotaxis protein